MNRTAASQALHLDVVQDCCTDDLGVSTSYKRHDDACGCDVGKTWPIK